MRSFGTSELGNPILVYQSDNEDSAFRILVIAGQHGDERIARAAAAKLIDSLSSRILHFSRTHVSVIQDCNPDGAASGTRRNAAGIDLNRDHQRLESAEIRALHSFVRSYKPSLILDVHNYPPRRKYLLAKNWILDNDVFIDWPSHPALHLITKQTDYLQLFEHVKANLQGRQFSCDRYVLVRRSGRVRHSTLDVKDARNGLALRYQTPVILIEGRTPTKEESSKDEESRIVDAEYEAVVSIVEWVQTRSDLFQNRSPLPRTNDYGTGRARSLDPDIPIRFRYKSFDSKIGVVFRNSATGNRDLVQLGNSAASELRITETVRMPLAYAILREKRSAIQIISRHGLNTTVIEPNEEKQITRIQSVKSHSETKNDSDENLLAEPVDLSRYVIFPTNQDGGRILPIFLEPDSKAFLGRYQDLGLEQIHDDGNCPILRINY